jgi:hypothetical protein
MPKPLIPLLLQNASTGDLGIAECFTMKTKKEMNKSYTMTQSLKRRCTNQMSLYFGGWGGISACKFQNYRYAK